MLILEFVKGLKAQRICVATAHICNGDDEELRKLKCLHRRLQRRASRSRGEVHEER
ncbi:hypothetical protein BGZ72_001533, partial [Mortierella alpina]